MPSGLGWDAGDGEEMQQSIAVAGPCLAVTPIRAGRTSGLLASWLCPTYTCIFSSLAKSNICVEI